MTSQLLSDMLHKAHACNYPDILAVIVKLISSLNMSENEEMENIRDIEVATGALIKTFKVSVTCHSVYIKVDWLF